MDREVMGVSESETAQARPPGSPKWTARSNDRAGGLHGLRGSILDVKGPVVIGLGNASVIGVLPPHYGRQMALMARAVRDARIAVIARRSEFFLASHRRSRGT